MALAAPSWAVSVSTVASGLDNPRALAFDSDGHLFVAEAGHGSARGQGMRRRRPRRRIPVRWLHERRQQDRKRRRASRRDGSGIERGPGRLRSPRRGISILGDWRLFTVEGESEFAVPPAGFSKEATAKAKAELGRLDEFTPGGHGRVLANVGGFDFKWSEEHKSLVPEQFPDANPYAALATVDGEYVIDAASNTVDWVREGKVKIVAFIPNPKVSDAVPTCVAKGPDGALYVGQLTGGGNGPGAASVWRVEPWDGDVSKWATGLTAVTGCGFDTDGDFYAVEFSTLGFESFKPETGALVSIAPANSGGGPTRQVLRITH
jgi:hypothetical protein